MTHPSRLLSIAHLSALDATPLELIAAAAEGGFGAVGLRIVAPRPGDVVAPVAGNPPAIRALKAELAARSVRVLDVEAVIISPTLDPATLSLAFEAAAELGAHYVLSNMYVPGRAQGAEAFARLCREAARFDLEVMLEFLPISELKTVGDALATLRLAGAPNGRLLVDALHLSRSGGHPRDLVGVPADLMPYAHICDAPAALPAPEALIPEIRTGRLLPGEGELPLAELIRTLPDGIPLAVEAPCRETAGLPVNERVARAGAAARKLLASL